MPLIVICGLPSSGKTTVSRKIFEYFQPKKNCLVISDSDLLNSHGRNNLFHDRNLEKEVRGSLKSQVVAHLNQDTLVILDSGNYIKGVKLTYKTSSGCRLSAAFVGRMPLTKSYRYELYCLSKEYKTTHCIVECLCDRETVVKNNGSRKEDEKYTQDVLDALIRRYEPPDSRNRWDSPHVAVTLDGILFEEITRVLYDRAAPPPNLSTQSRPVSDSSYLHLVDAETRRVVEELLKAQDMGQTSMKIPGSKSDFPLLTSPLSPAQLNKLRRQYMTYIKMHPITNPQEVTSSFLQFITSNSQ